MTDTTPMELDKQGLRELLPFHVNRSLDAAQTLQVQAGLEHYPELRAELAWLQTMRHTLQEHPLDPLPPGDLGWSVLAQRLASEAVPQARRAVRNEPGWLDTMRAWLQVNLMPVMATACALLVLQGVVIGTLLRPGEVYVPAGGPDSVGTPAQGVLLQVTLRPFATEPQWRAVLRRYQANIVQGPSALGIYTVQVPPSSALGPLPLDAAQVAVRLQREGSQVFESVSPAQEP